MSKSSQCKVYNSGSKDSIDDTQPCLFFKTFKTLECGKVSIISHQLGNWCQYIGWMNEKRWKRTVK
ncbi:hypothetical protein BLOT_003093 [Blomia tropicalis]|nr:hypothetical protein BLOT_003093 [Blomia tropicalis]